jgi:hypothetical protein
VYRDWQLPPAFAALRRSLEARLGVRAGARHYIRVLQLLARHPVSRVEQAIAARQARGVPEAAAIVAAVERLAGAPDPCSAVPAALAALTVPAPDLSRFDLLLSPSPAGDDPHD